MPRDVATRWNSTYDMLKFALEYRCAVDKMVMEKQLQAYELDTSEWEIVSQLTDVLKVRTFLDMNLLWALMCYGR